VREPDGLALSSRNVYLTPAERQIAPALHRTMREIANVAANGNPAAPALDAGKRALLAAGFAAIDYLALVDAATLEPLDKRDRPARVIAAAKLGAVRLIDNIAA
jgi:pantoate--beta-alanine ligase